eukprot:gb/GECH01012929.1/.p1 GENE.gb/GECH01012929.1/~~gb/GECH01012929.1/.p1  ORF type:complete len:240 (+),score=37.00 gb/GECH01012929.1/:1-720(+)
MVNFENWYSNIPIITRTYLTLTAITSLAVTFDVLTPFDLYLNFQNVYNNFQLWRLITNFLFFDRVSINFVFHVYFLYHYCRRLEEHSFQGRSADFLFMMIFGSGIMLMLAPLLDLPFLSHSLVVMVLYVWSRHNPRQHLQIYGLFTIRAPYLAYVLLGISALLGGGMIVDLVGILVGHMYYHLSAVLPAVLDLHPLKTPQILKIMFPERLVDVDQEWMMDEEEDQDQDNNGAQEIGAAA